MIWEKAFAVSFRAASMLRLIVIWCRGCCCVVGVGAVVVCAVGVCGGFEVKK
jgi:hypothetical protein